MTKEVHKRILSFAWISGFIALVVIYLFGATGYLGNVATEPEFTIFMVFAIMLYTTAWIIWEWMYYYYFKVRYTSQKNK